MKKRVIYNNTTYREAQLVLDSKIDGKHCTICGKKLPPKKRKYCSGACFNNWYQTLAPAQSWMETRRRAFKRDNHTCVKCGAKPVKTTTQPEYYDVEIIGYEVKNGVERAIIPDASQLIGDHIKPISLGGEEFDENNVQTLCLKCNKKKTRQDAKEIAKARQEEKLKAVGQRKLDKALNTSTNY